MKKKWFVVCTKPKHEFKVANQLSSIGVINYCPIITVLKQYSDRKKKIKRPILSAYIMVYIEEDNRNIIFSCKGVLRYLFYLGKPAVVNSSEIELMKNYLNGVYENVHFSNFVRGSNYKISDGPFSGLSGKVIESSNSKVKLQLKNLGIIVTLNTCASLV